MMTAYAIAFLVVIALMILPFVIFICVQTAVLAYYTAREKWLNRKEKEHGNEATTRAAGNP